MNALAFALLVSLATAILCAEAKAWTPKLIEKLLAVAIRLAPSSIRARMREEWSAHLAELPGTVAKIVAAVGFILAAKNLNTPAPLADRLHATALGARVSWRLLRLNLKSILQKKADADTLIWTVQLIGFIWRLLAPSVSGDRPRVYADNILESIATVLELAGSCAGEPEKLAAELAAIHLDRETGKINPHPSSTPR